MAARSSGPRATSSNAVPFGGTSSNKLPGGVDGSFVTPIVTSLAPHRSAIGVSASPREGSATTILGSASPTKYSTSPGV